MPFSVGDAVINVSPALVAGFEATLLGLLQRPFDSLAGRLGQNVAEAGQTLTRRLTLPIAVGTAANIAQFQSLDAKVRDTITLFGQAGDAVNETWEDLRAGVGGVTDEVRVLEGTVSQGLYQAISAGVPRENVFDFLVTASQAAVGGSTEVIVAVDGLTTAVNTFRGQGLEAEEASDILFRTVARGKTTFEQLAREMSSAAPLAAAAGISFEELNAVVATMTLLGTPTAEAFTNIRRALTGLLRPTAELNEIFQAAGFRTAEAAVQAVGYQQAMSIVVEAVDGSSAALIDLLGGAVAANAALQVTGENGEVFASIMDDVSNATGATTDAFNVMQSSARRTFGALFAELDQLGNLLGDIAFSVLAPFIRLLTSVVDIATDAVGWFSRLPAPIRALGASMVFAAAAAGPLLTIVGKLIGSKFGGLVGLFALLRLLGPTGVIRTVIGGLAVFGARITGIIPGLGGVTRGLVRLRDFGLAPLRAALGSAALAFGVWTVAVGGAVFALQRYLDFLGNVEADQAVMTEGIERLAESLDLVTKPAQELDRIDDITFDFSFRVENAALLTDLEEAEEAGFLEDRLVQLVFQLTALGNTPQDIAGVLEELQGAGINIPIDFDIRAATDPISFVDAITNSLEFELLPLLEDVQENLIFSDVGGFASLVPETRRLQGELRALGTQVATLFRVGESDLAIGLWESLVEVLGDGSRAADFLGDEILKAIDINDDLGFTISGVQRFDDQLAQLQERVNLVNNEIEETPPLLQLSGEAFNFLSGTAQNFATGISNIRSGLELAGEAATQLGAVADAGGQLQAVVSEQAARIQQDFFDIREGIRQTIPFWGEYAGAADLSATDVTKSVDTFVADLQRWTDLNESLAGQIPDDLRAQLNELPLEQRAALADLAEESPGDFQQVIDAYQTAFNLANDVALQTWTVDLPASVAEGNSAILQEALKIESEMGRVGRIAAGAWQDEFERIARGWAATVQRFAGEAVSTAREEFGIRSPSRVFQEIGSQVVAGFRAGLESGMRTLGASSLGVGAQQRLAGTAPTTRQGDTYNININNPRGDTSEASLVETLEITRTASLLRGLR